MVVGWYISLHHPSGAFSLQPEESVRYKEMVLESAEIEGLEVSAQRKPLPHKPRAEIGW